MRIAKSSVSKPRRLWRSWLRIVAGVAMILVAVPMADYLSLYLANPLRPSVLSRTTLAAVPKMVLAVPAYYRHALAGESQIVELGLRIEARDFQKIADKRREALEVGVLFSSRQDLVPAALPWHAQDLNARVRLKGDLSDHWAGNRWSLRVEVDGDDLLGMRRFSLHAPWARGFHLEPLFLDVLRSSGFLAPRADIVDLSINGRHIGLMEIEGHIGSELLTGSVRPRGIFLKLDEDRLWREWVAGAERLGVPWSIEVPKPKEADNWRTARIDAFEMREIRASESLSAHHARATELLQGAMDGELSPSEVFDAERWGAFLAHCDIFGATHMVLWNNLRFYFDPTSDRLEPVAFDTGVLPGRQRQALATGVSLDCVGGELALTTALVADPVIRSAFIQALRRLDPQVQAEPFEDFLRERERRYLGALGTDYPWLHSFDLDAVRRRAAALQVIDEDNFENHVRGADATRL